MSLRERLQGRARRRASVLVQVEDTATSSELLAAARIRLNNTLTALDDARAGDVDEEDVARLQAELDPLRDEVQRALNAQSACYAAIEMVALPAPEWEAVVAAHPAEGDDQWIDWQRALPVILAASCVAEDLQDEQWWGEFLASPATTAGQRDTFRAQVTELNLRPFDVAADPKG
jgi:hypothetical protein